MAYNQGFQTQQYPSDQRQGRYQRVQQDGSYHNYGNGAYTNNGGQFEASYGGPNGSSEYQPQPPKAYHRVYPNDGFYRGEIQSGPQDFNRGQAVSEGYGDGYGSIDQGNNHGIGQAIPGDYQSSAEPAYTPEKQKISDAQQRSPERTGWDGPFPSFPTAKNKPQKLEPIDKPTLNDVANNGGVANGSRNVPYDGRPQTAGSKGSQRSMRSGGQLQVGQRKISSQGENQGQENSRTQPPTAEGARLTGQGGPGYHEYGYGGEGHNMVNHPDSGPRNPGQASWQEPGPTAGYHGPEDPGFLPQGDVGGRPPPNGHPQIAGDGDAYPDHRRQESFGDVLDAYFESEGGSHVVQGDSYAHGPPAREDSNAHPSQPSSALQQSIEEDMPNFDAQPSQPSNHKRGMSIENHLPGLGRPSPAAQPTHSNSLHQDTARPIEPQQPREFAAQVQRSRSQPDFRRVQADQRTMTAGAGGGVFEMAGDVPATPAVPQEYAEPQYQGNRYGSPNAYPNDYSQQPRGRGGPRFAEGQGPVRSQTWNNGQHYPQRPLGPQHRPAGPQQQFAPGPGQRMSPDFRQQYPPGPTPQMRPGPRPQIPPGSRQQLPLRQRTNPGAGVPPFGPASHRSPEGMSNINAPPPRPPSSTSRFGNPDALPQHPTPIRPGLMQGSVVRQASPPPPVRQYNNTGTPANQGPPPNSVAQADNVGDRRSSIPVTYDELERLKRHVDANPLDQAAQLLLAKKWIEAAAVLVDKGGADLKTRNRAREKFIFDGHKLIKKLVNANYAEAMFYLADCYGKGLLGLEADQKEAFNLYQSAAKLGHAPSAYRTAVCCEMGHEDGGGTKKDPLKAIQWYKRAATLGDTPAMYKMGIILLKGLLGQQKNPREAIVWLKRAAERANEENPHALHELGLLYENAGNNDSIIRDENYASQLFTQAAELGYKFSQFRIGCAFEYGSLGYPIDHRQSIIWYSRAAVQGEHQSELALSGWYLTGSEGILQQSDTEAYLWARKAAQAGLAKAEYALGYFTEVGIGTPESLEDAKRWYWRAAAQNFPKARERLEELKSGGSKVQKSRERHSRSNMTKQNEGDCVVM